jgi:hypothetical protein
MLKRKLFVATAGLAGLTGCNRLDGLQHPQALTPQQLLDTHPHLLVPWGEGSWVLMEPSSSLLIFALAVLIFGMGVQLLRTAGQQRSRFWWGLSLLLWGAGAFVAGVSYQAFAYELKAAGRDVMAWTTWWEVNYLLLTTASINAMMMGVAYSTCGEVGRRRLAIYAVLNTLIYFVLCLIGAFLPDRFLVSFELMVLITTPGYVVFFVLNLRAYRQQHELLQWRLMQAWVFLGLVMALYFAYLAAGFTEALWALGWWFSANDVLHAGLLLWMIWLQRCVLPLLKDRAVQ